MLNSYPTSERIRATNKSNPCPLCGNTSGHDKFSGEGVLCHNGLDGASAGNGYRYIKNTSNDQWGVYYPDNGQEYDREKAEKIREQRIEKERKQLQKALPVADRDKYYRLLAAVLPKKNAIADLLNRSLSIEQIERYHFFDIRGGQFVPDSVPDHFPGIREDWKFSNDRKVFSYAAVQKGSDWQDLEGYGVPCYTLDGEIRGFQIRNTQGEQPKYKWPANSKLPNGEMPLTVFAKGDSKDLWGCDGILKALVASEKHDINIIGAFGGNYEACQSQVKEVKERLKPNRFIQAVDGGDLINHSVVKRFKNQYRFLKSLELEVVYAWWGQTRKKESPDIDELDNLDGIRYLSHEELETLIYQEKVLNEQKKLNNFTHPIDLSLNTKYLPDLVDLIQQKIIPETGILNLGSYKGSGKSQQLKNLIEYFKTQRKNIISIVPRIALGREQANKWNIEWIEDAKINEIDVSTYRENCQTIGLCWDSLGKLYSRNWSNTVVIIDESEQGFSHLVTSSTLKDRRSFILKTIQEKILECLINNGLVILSDADLTDVSVDYIKKLAPDNTPIFSIVNQYLPQSLDIEFNTGKRDCVLEELFQKIEDGLKAVVATDSQREAESLDRVLGEKFPDKKIVRIDGKTCSEDFGKNFVEKINESIIEEKPDILIHTSSMGTGVSIDIEYFDVNFGFFFGVLEPSQARQMLARERNPIPRIVWCEDFKVPSGCPSYIPETIKRSLQKYNQDSLKISDLLGIDETTDCDEDIAKLKGFWDDIQEQKGEWNNPHLDLYAKFKARYNYGVGNLSLLLREQLIEEGHNIIDYGSDDATNLGSQVKETKEELKIEEATKTANSEDIDIETARKLNCRATKTEKERYQIIKAFLKEELPRVELTPHFILKAIIADNRRWLNSVKLFWYCQNPEKTYSIDKKYLKGKIINQKGVTLLSDFKTYSPKAKLINDLGLFKLIDLTDLDKEYSGKDKSVIEFRDRAYFFRYKIYQSFRLTVTPKTDPIKLIEKLLDRFGLDLEQSDRRQVSGERVRFYRLNRQKLLDPDRISVLDSMNRKYSQTATGQSVQSGQDSPKVIYISESCPLEPDNRINHQEVSVKSRSISIVKPEDDAASPLQVSQDSSKIIYINESPVTAKIEAASKSEPSVMSHTEEILSTAVTATPENDEPQKLEPIQDPKNLPLPQNPLPAWCPYRYGDKVLSAGSLYWFVEVKDNPNQAIIADSLGNLFETRLMYLQKFIDQKTA